MIISDELLRQLEEMPPSMGSQAYARRMTYQAWASGWPIVFEFLG